MEKSGFRLENKELVSENYPKQWVCSTDQLRLHAIEALSKMGSNWLNHLNVFVPAHAASRLMYWHELYQKIIDVQGVICEFGVQYGASLAQLLNCRNFYEPHNSTRLIYGFDTFEGLMGVEAKDGQFAKDGSYATGDDYFTTLNQILSIHESLQPRPEIKRFELIKGDACETIDQWLDDNPHAIIAMAIFDMDIYKPTKIVLEKILPRLTKGSLLVFDELNSAHFPGETRAVDEVLGLNKIALRKTRWSSGPTYTVWGE